jgi:hypothetical protein
MIEAASLLLGLLDYKATLKKVGRPYEQPTIKKHKGKTLFTIKRGVDFFF